MSVLTHSTTSKTNWDFDPRSIPDCDIWFDAADSTTLTTRGTLSTVAAWKNKGSIDINAVEDTVGANGGATRIIVVGNNTPLPIVIPAGTQMAFTCALTSQARTWFIVARCATQLVFGSSPQFWGIVGNLVAGQEAITYSRTASGSTTFTYGTSAYTLGSQCSTNVAPNSFGDLAVICVVQSATSTADSTITINGTTYTPNVNQLATQFLTTSQKYLINNASYNTAGYYGEIIHYNRAITRQERIAVEGYLMWKWGIKRQNEVGFIPTNISGCLAWYHSDVNYADATSRSNNFTFSSGDLVDSWKDMSGNGRNATFLNTSPSTTRPTLTASQVTGKPTVVFNGTNILSSPLSLSTTQAVTLVLVAASTSLSAFRAAVSLNARPGTRGSLLSIYQSGGNLWWFSGGNVGTDGQTSSISLASGRYDILANYWNTTIRTQMNINGHHVQASTSSPPSLTANSTMLIGGTTSAVAGSTTPAELWIGGIAEIIVYDGILTIDERNQVERYLSLKWNRPLVNACPIGHPNKWFPDFSRTFTPNDISGCSLWLDGADQSAIQLSGSNVTQWTDKSPNAYNAVQATAGNQPTFTGSGIIFNGSTSYLQVSNPAIRPAQIFIVAQTSSPTGHLLRKGSGGGVDFEFAMRYTASNFQALYANTGSTVVTAEFSGGVSTSIVLLEATWNGTTITSYTNGTQRATAALSGTQFVATTGATDLRIGAEFASASNTSGPFAGTLWNGTIYEIVLYNTFLSTGDRQKVEGYLSAKWGLRQLLPKSTPAFNGISPPSPLSAGFTPTSISGCRAWYDASDSASITLSGSNVSQWNDKSGNALHMTGRNVYGTAIVASGFQNGLNVLSCSGQTIYEAPAGSAIYPLDCYVVVALKSPLTRCDVFAITAPSPTDNFNSLTFSEHTSLRWHNGSSNFSRTPLTVSPINETSNDFLIMNWSLANNNFIVRRNGVNLASTASYTFTLTANSRFQMGARQFGFPTDVSLNAYIAEIVVYSGQLSMSDRQRIETYLATKWDIRSSLPSSHLGYYTSQNTDVINFNPATSISGCQLWVDASDTTTINSGIITTGGTVTSLTNKSNSSAITTLGTPTWNYSLNKLPTLIMTSGRFTGSFPNALTGFKHTAFIVTQLNSNPTAGYPCLSIGNSASSSTRFVRCLDWATTIRTVGFFSNTPAATITAPANGTPFLWTSLYSGDTVMIASLNSASTRTTATPAPVAPGANAGFFNIGCETLSTLGTANTWPGHISEIIVYDTLLSATNRIRVESYLARKWGLSQSILSTNRFTNPGTIPDSPRIFPTTFADIALWLDAADPDADGILPASGTKIGAWIDKSGNSRTCVQTTESQKPTFTFVGNYPAIQFDSNNSQFMRGPSLLTSLNYGIFIVHEHTGGTGQSPATVSFFCRKVTTANAENYVQITPFTWFFNELSSIDIFYNANSTAPTRKNLTFGFSLGKRLNVISDNSAAPAAGQSTFFVDGTLGTQSNTAGGTANVATDAEGYRLGASNQAGSLGNYLTGNIYEVIVMLHRPTTLERQLIEGYLGWKWGANSSLPSTHPYRKVSP